MRNAAIATGLALLLAACATGPAIDPATFPGGVLRVNHAGAAEDIVIFVNPDGSLAGTDGAATLSGWTATRGRLAFTAAPGEGAPERAFALTAAPFGPDYAGTATVTGACAADCTREATAWWARGKEQVTLPK